MAKKPSAAATSSRVKPKRAAAKSKRKPPAKKADAEPVDEIWGDAPETTETADKAEVSSDVPALLTGEGAEAWRRVLPVLRAAGFVKARDLEPVTRYCYLLGRFWKAAADIEQNGLTYKVPSTHQHVEGETTMLTKRNPAAFDQDRILPELRQLEDRLGISPRASAEIMNKGLRGGQTDLPFGQSEEGDGGSRSDRPNPAAYH